MNEIHFENLNKTPVRTKNWLNVNEVNLNDYDMPETKNFTNTIFNEDIRGVSIERVEEHKILQLNKPFVYGVSDELIEQGEKEFNEGYLIKIEKDTNVESPIIIEFQLDNVNNFLVDNLTIVAEENSKANIVLKYKSLDQTLGYHNGVCKIFAKQNSELRVVKVNLLNDRVAHFDSNISDVQGEGSVDFVAVDLGGKYSITNYHGDLVGQNASSTVNSIYLGWDKKIIDINYVITHKGKESKSQIVTKGALDDESKKTFRGTIDFKRGASGSIGSEDEYCLMLSKEARAKAMPLLLCEEENVSGEHAASSGKIDEDKLFYLMTRGLSFEEARRLIVQATFNPIIDKIGDEAIISEIVNEIDRRLINER